MKERTERDGLIEALNRMPVRIKSIVDYRMAADRLFPQVPLEELEELYAAMNKGEVIAAVPPTSIRGAAVPIGMKKGLLCFAGLGKEASYEKEARDYAKNFWNKKLRTVKALDLIKIYLQNPKTLGLEGCVYVALSRFFEDIVNASGPKSTLFNEAIVFLTGDRLVCWELASTIKNLAQIPVFFQCSRCGGKLAAYGCLGCGKAFGYDSNDAKWRRESLGLALPEKIETFLDKSIHKSFFEVSPVEGRIEERRAWNLKAF